MTVCMGQMTVAEVSAYLEHNRTIILPYGVVEQHGYHLPLDTDIRNAEVMGKKLAEELGCIVAPTLNYCFSGGLLVGTINVKPATFCLMVGEIIESLARQGFENIIIIPGHGGSESMFALKESLRMLKWLNPALEKVLIMMTPLWDYSPTWLRKFGEHDYHAAEVETSLIKYWTPEAVRDEIVMDEAEISEAMRRSPDYFQHLTALSGDAHEIPSTRQKDAVRIGVMGYPERHSLELGGQVTGEILENAVPALKKAIAEAEESRRTGKVMVLPSVEETRIMSL